MGIGCPGVRTWAYISKRSTVRVSSDIRAKGEGLLDASLYHPHIRNHASLTRGGSKARRELIVLTASSALLFQSVLKPAWICQLSLRTVRWAPSWSALNLESIDARVLSEIHACLTRSRR